MTFLTFLFCLLHKKKKSLREVIGRFASEDKLSLLIVSPQIPQVPCLGAAESFLHALQSALEAVRAPRRGLENAVAGRSWVRLSHWLLVTAFELLVLL